MKMRKHKHTKKFIKHINLFGTGEFTWDNWKAEFALAEENVLYFNTEEILAKIDRIVELLKRGNIDQEKT